MKDLVVLRSTGDVADYVGGLWRTDVFRRSAYVAGWVSRLACPMVFAEMSDIDLEYPHFATWFGMTYARTYSDAAVSDLYYLHEIVHAALLHYEPRPLFTAWYRKMNGIELSASLETECYVYLSVPGAREISFRDEIWADRYLGGPSRLGDSLRDVIRQDRYKAMQHPDPMDYCEQQIAAYARQNFEWANGWKLEVAPGPPGVRRGGGAHERPAPGLHDRRRPRRVATAARGDPVSRSGAALRSDLLEQQAVAPAEEVAPSLVGEGALVRVAPRPILAALEGRDHRVLGGVEVLGRVLVGRRVAAGDVAAGEALAKVHPAPADGHAVHACLAGAVHRPDRGLRHVPAGSAEVDVGFGCACHVCLRVGRRS